MRFEEPMQLTPDESQKVPKTAQKQYPYIFEIRLPVHIAEKEGIWKGIRGIVEPVYGRYVTEQVLTTIFFSLYKPTASCRNNIGNVLQ